MAAKYFVEFRLHGYAKEYSKWVISLVRREAQRLGIKGQWPVPHMSLFGPAEGHSLRRMVSEVERIGEKYTLLPFKISGFGRFDTANRRVIYLDITPSPEVEQFERELAEGLIWLSTEYTEWDGKLRKKLHSTVGIFNNCESGRFERLYAYTKSHCGLEDFRRYKASIWGRLLNTVKRWVLGTEEEERGIHQHLLRVTIVGKGSKIWCEYDMLLKMLLDRRRSLSRYWWKKSIEKLRDLQRPPRREPEPAQRGSMFFISDTHFDHRNIIKYCHRPFSSVDEMNRKIVRNWNDTVSDNDRVYFLGDWTFGRRHRSVGYWRRQLNGRIVTIRGSHDRGLNHLIYPKTKVLTVNGQSFLLIHDPKDRKTKWHGWIIHGHFHNNQMDRYPFINGEEKTINVSVEVTGYKPVSLDLLLSLDLQSIRRMRTVYDQPERW